MKHLKPEDIVAKASEPPVKLSRAVAPLNAALAAEHAAWLELAARVRKQLSAALGRMRRQHGESWRRKHPKSVKANQPAFIAPKLWTDTAKAMSSLVLGLLREGRELEKRAGANDLTAEELMAELKLQVERYLLEMDADELAMFMQRRAH